MSEQIERNKKQAILRGMALRCPNCGKGPMLHSYLKVQDRCKSCGQELHHHRADDGPPYITIMIVGHIIGPLMLSVYTAYEPAAWIMLTVFCTASIVLCLGLLPIVKGGIIGIQWATRMGGFDAPSPAPLDANSP